MKELKYIRQVLFMKMFRVKIYTLMILQVFLLYIYTKPLVKYSDAVNYKVAPWIFPFILSNIYFLFLFMLEVVYYFSDVPFMQYQNMYQIIRAGRRRWAVGQIGSIALQSALIMLFNFVVSVLCLRGRWEANIEWGKLLHTAALTNASDYYGMYFSISYNAMQHFSPLALVLLTLVMGSLVIFFLGLFMFAISLFAGRMVAVVTATGMVVMIYFVENVHPLLAQAMAKFVPVCWMRTANIGVKVHDSYVMPPVSYMLGVLLAGIAILCIVIVWKVRTVEFQWNKED